ncbi:MAG: PQQ-binding-like beta-propeller repeat protein [Myxococcaceae bacterium]
MLRIRIGQHWKHEGAAEAVDGFGLELDGMALVQGASEEPLGRVMEQLLVATAALAAGQRLAQVSLPESSQELLLVRRGEQLHLHVLRLGRPAAEVRAPVTLDPETWRRAVARAARRWIEDLRTMGAPGRVRARARALLSQADREPKALAALAPGWGLRLEPRRMPGFRLEAADPEGMLGGQPRRAPVPVSALALPGSLVLLSPDGASWRARGMVGLLAFELLRQGEEVVHALEAGEAALRLSPAGGAPSWQLELLQGKVLAPGWALAWPAAELAEAMVAPALGLTSLLTSLDATLGENHYLSDFTSRGRSVLAALRGLVARPTQEPRAPRRPARRRTSPELQRGARVRRLGFVQRGQAKGLASEGESDLRPLGQGFLLSAPTRAVAVTSDGQLVRRWTAPAGLAVGPGREALLATETRWAFLDLEQPDARWLRESDGAALEGRLVLTDAHLLVTTQPSGVRALDRLTGRELWRFLPQRPQRLLLGLHSGRVLVASESGVVHGLDVAEGSVRFRIAGPLPCLGPPVAWGHAAVVTLGRSDRMAVLVFDAHDGAVRWLREFPLTAAAMPLARGARLRLLAQRDGAPVLLCLGPKGATQWERSLPLGRGPWTLHADGEASLAAAADGSVLRVDAQGRLDWRLGGQRLPTTAAASLQRRVLLVPGETIRAVDARSGRVVAEIPAPGGLHALSVNEALDVAVLDAAGDLTVWKLGASLGVVE